MLGSSDVSKSIKDIFSKMLSSYLISSIISGFRFLPDLQFFGVILSFIGQVVGDPHFQAASA